MGKTSSKGVLNLSKSNGLSAVGLRWRTARWSTAPYGMLHKLPEIQTAEIQDPACCITGETVMSKTPAAERLYGAMLFFIIEHGKLSFK